VPIAPRASGDQLGVGPRRRRGKPIEKRRHGRHGRRRDEAKQIDGVHAEVDQTTTTGPLAVEEPSAAAPRSAGLRDRRRRGSRHLAEATVSDETLRGTNGATNRVLWNARSTTWFASATAIISVSVLVVHAHRLVDQHVLSRPRRGPPDVVVQRVRHCKSGRHRRRHADRLLPVRGDHAASPSSRAPAPTTRPARERSDLDAFARNAGRWICRAAFPQRPRRTARSRTAAGTQPCAPRLQHRRSRAPDNQRRSGRSPNAPRAPRCGDTTWTVRAVGRVLRARPGAALLRCRAPRTLRRQVHGKSRYICAHGTPSRASAAAKRLASVGSGRNHVTLEDPSPSGSGRAPVSPSMSPTPSTIRALLARSDSRIPGKPRELDSGDRACELTPCAGSRPARLGEPSPRELA